MSPRMTPRNLKIALAVSAALNVFALAAIATGVIGSAVVDRRVAEEREPRRGPPVMQVIDDLDPAVRDRVRGSLRSAALAARPDFKQAREARRQAIEMARADAFDAAATTALLVQSRDAEQRGRAVLEAEAIRVLASLDADDREKLAPILSRHGGRMRGRTTETTKATD